MGCSPQRAVAHGGRISDVRELIARVRDSGKYWDNNCGWVSNRRLKKFAYAIERAQSHEHYYSTFDRLCPLASTLVSACGPAFAFGLGSSLGPDFGSLYGSGLAASLAPGLSGGGGSQCQLWGHPPRSLGLPEAALKESRDRVSTVLTDSGFKFPMGCTTFNLAPADVKK
jgi:hypothetical protein